MKFTALLQRVLIILLPAMFTACAQCITSEQFITGTVDRIDPTDTIRNFMTEAECCGPKGDYKTIVYSDSGYTYFRQMYSYSNTPFEAVIVENEGHQIENDSLGDSLNKETIAALKSHEFHMILLDLDKRFHQFGKLETHGNQIRVSALDNLNNSVSISFTKDQRVESITMRNPGDTTEVIRFAYSNWKTVQGIILPLRVSIQQGADKKFEFEFTRVEINSRNFKHREALKRPDQ